MASIKESTEHIKKILMDCNFMRTRSKKLEHGMGIINSSMNSNRFTSSALDTMQNKQAMKIYDSNQQSRHSALR